MPDRQCLGHPRVLMPLLAALLLFSSHGMAVDVGDLAPAFELQSLDGETLRLADYRGRKAVYLVFWNTWCGYCIRKLPRYRKLHETFGDRVEIIAVNTTWSDSIQEIERLRRRFEINYPVALDEGELLTGSYDVHDVPTEFIIDIDGVIRYRDGVPEYLATHIPDWFAPFIADRIPALVCSK